MLFAFYLPAAQIAQNGAAWRLISILNIKHGLQRTTRKVDAHQAILLKLS
jgi:hypothetical protein